MLQHADRLRARIEVIDSETGAHLVRVGVSYRCTVFLVLGVIGLGGIVGGVLEGWSQAPGVAAVLGVASLLPLSLHLGISRWHLRRRLERTLARKHG